MTDENIEKLIQMNQRLLLVMGYATSIIVHLRQYIPIEDDHPVAWFIQAMENIVYLDKPFPPMPER